jgi:hypothetical protein
MSCFTACKRTQSDVEVALSAKFLGHFSPIVPPSAAGFASVASCGESWNALNPWFSSKLGV